MKAFVLSAFCFVASALFFFFSSNEYQNPPSNQQQPVSTKIFGWSSDWHLILLLFLLLISYGIHQKQTNCLVLDVCLISLMLGSFFSYSLLLALHDSAPQLRPLFCYIALMCVFHFLEFLLTAMFHSHSLSISSFLLNQSKEYVIAFVASVSEYLIEVYLIEDLKNIQSIFWTGLTVCVTGDLLRKAAMVQAGVNFTHLLQYSRRSNHKLVTDGFYGVVRHPTYTGWCLFAVSSQVMLINPLCTVLFTYAAFVFFSERVEEEELLLISFFGKEYIKYKSQVPSGLPFIKGPQLMSS